MSELMTLREANEYVNDAIYLEAKEWYEYREEDVTPEDIQIIASSYRDIIMPHVAHLNPDDRIFSPISLLPFDSIVFRDWENNTAIKFFEPSITRKTVELNRRLLEDCRLILAEEDVVPARKHEFVGLPKEIKDIMAKIIVPTCILTSECDDYELVLTKAELVTGDHVNFSQIDAAEQHFVSVTEYLSSMLGKAGWSNMVTHEVRHSAGRLNARMSEVGSIVFTDVLSNFTVLED